MSSNTLPCFYRVSTKALIFDENKRILLAREQNGFWDLLGGGLEHNENMRDALAREIAEETGITESTIEQSPALVTQANIARTDNTPVINIVYKTKLKTLDFTPSEECLELKFFSKEEIIQHDNMSENVAALANLL